MPIQDESHESASIQRQSWVEREFLREKEKERRASKFWKKLPSTCMRYRKGRSRR